MVEISQSTLKRPGDPRKLTVTQTPVKNANKRKRICKIVDFAVPADHRINLKESEKKDKYLDLARELKKTVEHESNDCANCDWCIRHSN